VALNEDEKREFLALVDDINAGVGRRGNARRVLGRLRMRAFVEKHGKEACDEVFAKTIE